MTSSRNKVKYATLQTTTGKDRYFPRRSLHRPYFLHRGYTKSASAKPRLRIFLTTLMMPDYFPSILVRSTTSASVYPAYSVVVCVLSLLNCLPHNNDYTLSRKVILPVALTSRSSLYLYNTNAQNSPNGFLGQMA